MRGETSFTSGDTIYTVRYDPTEFLFSYGASQALGRVVSIRGFLFYSTSRGCRYGNFINRPTTRWSLVNPDERPAFTATFIKEIGG